MNTEREQVFLVNSASNAAGFHRSDAAPGAITVPVNLEDVQDFSTVCRTCATITEFVIPIFEGEGLQNNLADVIRKHLPIQVSANDLLPRVVCYQCASTLLAWHELVKCCMQAEEALKARLAQLQPTTSQGLENEWGNGNSTNDQNRWLACRDRLQEVPPPAQTLDTGQSDESIDTTGLDEHTKDEDDEPLSNVASRKSSDAYSKFYSALLNFRNHFFDDHDNKCKYPDLTDSSDTEEPNEFDETEVNLDSFDDLTQSNMRKDKMDEETRLELNQVQIKVNGKVYYACKLCGKNLSSSHTYVYHKRIHTGERPCVCHVCGKQFRAPNGLQRHLTETHERLRRHACHYCPKNFVNLQNLKQHMRIHTGERPYVCPHCGKRFTQSGTLYVHIKTHTDHFPFECAECGAKFRLRAGLARHRLKHSGERPHACGLCAAAFRHKHELASHRAAHSDARPHACAACGAAFRLRRALRLHARRAHGAGAGYPQAPQYYSPPGYAALAACPYCRSRRPAAQHQRHLVEHHAHLLFHCQECDNYVDRKDLLLHMTFHCVLLSQAEQTKKNVPIKVEKTDAKVDPPTANITSSSAKKTPKSEPKRAKTAIKKVKTEPKRSTKRKVKVEATDENENRKKKSTVKIEAGMDTNVAENNRTTRKQMAKRNVDAEENEFSDHSDAEYGFGPLPESVFDAIEDSQDAADHKPATPSETSNPQPDTEDSSNQKNSEKKKLRTCPLCSKTYTASSSFFYHMKHFHRKSKEHACEVCGRKFGTRACLQQHASLHTGECRLECACCGKRFRSKASLYIHSQIHTKNAGCKCEVCGKEFRWGAALRKHLSRHAGARAHACSTCGRAFSVRADLTRHARTHARRDLRCARCAATFAQPRYLRVHMQRKHGIKETPDAAGLDTTAA